MWFREFLSLEYSSYPRWENGLLYVLLNEYECWHWLILSESSLVLHWKTDYKSNVISLQTNTKKQILPHFIPFSVMFCMTLCTFCYMIIIIICYKQFPLTFDDHDLFSVLLELHQRWYRRKYARKRYGSYKIFIVCT